MAANTSDDRRSFHYFFGIHLAEYISNFCLIENPTPRQWQTAGDVYRYLIHTPEARHDLVQIANSPRFEEFDSFHFHHSLLPFPIFLRRPFRVNRLYRAARQDLRQVTWPRESEF